MLEDNAAYGNATSEGIGIFLRDASHGTVRGNRLEGNCSGLIAVDTAGDGPVADWPIRDNVVRENTAACQPSDDIPLPLSGLGIAALGTTDTTVRGNTVEGNRPSLDAPVAGGIVLASAVVGRRRRPDRHARPRQPRGRQRARPTSSPTAAAGQPRRRQPLRDSVPDGLCR